MNTTPDKMISLADLMLMATGTWRSSYGDPEIVRSVVTRAVTQQSFMRKQHAHIARDFDVLAFENELTDSVKIDALEEHVANLKGDGNRLIEANERICAVNNELKKRVELLAQTADDLRATGKDGWQVNYVLTEKLDMARDKLKQQKQRFRLKAIPVIENAKKAQAKVSRLTSTLGHCYREIGELQSALKKANADIEVQKADNLLLHEFVDAQGKDIGRLCHKVDMLQQNVLDGNMEYDRVDASFKAAKNTIDALSRVVAEKSETIRERDNKRGFMLQKAGEMNARIAKQTTEIANMKDEIDQGIADTNFLVEGHCKVLIKKDEKIQGILRHNETLRSIIDSLREANENMSANPCAEIMEDAGPIVFDIEASTPQMMVAKDGRKFHIAPTPAIFEVKEGERRYIMPQEDDESIIAFKGKTPVDSVKEYMESDAKTWKEWMEKDEVLDAVEKPASDIGLQKATQMLVDADPDLPTLDSAEDAYEYLMEIMGKLGKEEGNTCNRLDGENEVCQGIIELDALLGCTCHLGHPPCSACTDREHICPECGWEESAD